MLFLFLLFSWAEEGAKHPLADSRYAVKVLTLSLLRTARLASQLVVTWAPVIKSMNMQ